MNFKEKLKKQMHKLWSRPEEMSLVKMLLDLDIQSFADIESFLVTNKEVYDKTSIKFKSEINSLQEKVYKNKNKMKAILEQKVGFDNWVIFREGKEIKAEKQNSSTEYHGYLNESGYIQWANYFAVPYLVREAVDKYCVERKLNEDDTTLDLAIPDTPVGFIKREPFVDVYEEVEGDEAKVCNKSIKESVKPFAKKNYVIISEKIQGVKNNIELIVECEGKKHRVLIPKQKFSEFLVENAITAGYMQKGKLLLENMMQERSFNMKTLYLKEFIDAQLEADNEAFVNGYAIDGDTLTIRYTDGYGNTDIIDVNVDEATEWLEKNDPTVEDFLETFGTNFDNAEPVKILNFEEYFDYLSEQPEDSNSRKKIMELVNKIRNEK